jgi:hypothetical protein
MYKDSMLLIKHPCLISNPTRQQEEFEKFELPEWNKNIIVKARARGHGITDF